MRERLAGVVGLVGGHLKTSIISFLSFFLSSCFLFFFLLHKFWSSWAIEEREREKEKLGVVWCGLFFVFDGEGRACNFNVSSSPFFGCAFFSVMMWEKERIGML